MSHDHDHAQTAVDHRDAASRRFSAILSLLIGLLMLGGKWLAYSLTGSHAILSDALESVVHVAATAFALYSLILSARPPDPAYPYGYGKIGYFSAGFEGGLIALAALAIFYEAGQGLLNPAPLRRLDLGLVLIVAASVINLVLGWYLIRVGRQTQSLIIEADGHHVLSDSYTSFGVVLGVFLVKLTGWYWVDPAVAFIVGANILWTGARLVREAYSGLIVDRLHARRRPGWIDIHQLRAWQSGDRTFVDFHLVVPRDWNTVQLHEALDQARDELRDELGPHLEANIHFDPERPDMDYPHAEAWTLESAQSIPSEVDRSGETPVAQIQQQS